MIYTCYEMVRDCRADLPEGWTHFISYYIPVSRRILAQYAPEQAGVTYRADNDIAVAGETAEQVVKMLDQWITK